MTTPREAHAANPVATIDWTCAQCGTRETLQLVMADRREGGEPPHAGHPAPTLDWACSQCGTTETWQLVRV